MNDSTNTGPETPETPEPTNTGDERTTPSSTAPDDGARLNQDDQPTVPQPTVGQSTSEQPTVEQPTLDQPTAELPSAHTLPHRTGPTPAHYVNSADQGATGENRDDSYQAYDPATGAQAAGGQPQNVGYGQAPYPQAPYATHYDQYGRPVYTQAPYGQAGQAPYGQPQNGGYGQPQNGAYAQAPYGYGQVPPAFVKPKRQRKRWMTITGAIAAGVIIAGAAGTGAFELGHATGEQAASAAGQQQTLQIPNGSSGNGGFSFGGGSGSSGGGTFGGEGGSGSSGGSSSGTVPSSATAATATEKQGLVTIVSTLNYDESSKSAGTGMIMTSNGTILTNNHVVQGATSIQVTVVSTGKTYTADVVGTDATHDVAVLKLQNASGLTPVTFDKTTNAVSTGDAIHSTGNAEGTGSLVTAKGTVTATKQAITVQSESGSGTESLSNLIEISADVVSGDSGGPLRNSAGDVVGIVTAASSGTSDVTGYAIPISDALSVATKIRAGESSQDITIGLPAFLGVEIAAAGTGDGTGDGTGTEGGTGTGGGTGTTGTGATIAGTVTGSAAAKAGLVAGDTITAVDGTSVADATALTTAIESHKVGDSVTITYTDASGASHSVSVTLGSGPAA